MPAQGVETSPPSASRRLGPARGRRSRPKAAVPRPTRVPASAAASTASPAAAAAARQGLRKGQRRLHQPAAGPRRRLEAAAPAESESRCPPELRPPAGDLRFPAEISGNLGETAPRGRAFLTTARLLRARRVQLVSTGSLLFKLWPVG